MQDLTPFVVALSVAGGAGHPGPVFAGRDVVYGRVTGGALVVQARPAAGGPARSLPSIGDVAGADLAADGSHLAVRVRRRSGRYAIYAARVGARPELRAAPVRAGFSSQLRDLFADGGDILSLEEAGIGEPPLVARGPRGPGAAVRLPDDGVSSFATALGARVALPAVDGARQDVVVLNRHSGAQLRRIRVLGDEPFAIGLGRDGAIAYAAQRAIFWAAAGSASFTAVAATPEIVNPVVRDGRIAYVESTRAGLDRPIVISAPPAARVLFRGPPAAHVRTIDFDGEHVAWSTDRCQLVATIAGPDVTAIPPGPCLRTDAAVSIRDGAATRADPYVRVRVRCATGPHGRCELTVTALSAGRVAGTARAGVAAGSSAVVRVRVPPGHYGVRAVLRDPSGRRRAVPIA